MTSGADESVGPGFEHMTSRGSGSVGPDGATFGSAPPRAKAWLVAVAAAVSPAGSGGTSTVAAASTAATSDCPKLPPPAPAVDESAASVVKPGARTGGRSKVQRSVSSSSFACRIASISSGGAFVAAELACVAAFVTAVMPCGPGCSAPGGRRPRVAAPEGSGEGEHEGRQLRTAAASNVAVAADAAGAAGVAAAAPVRVWAEGLDAEGDGDGGGLLCRITSDAARGLSCSLLSRGVARRLSRTAVRNMSRSACLSTSGPPCPIRDHASTGKAAGLFLWCKFIASRNLYCSGEVAKTWVLCTPHSALSIEMRLLVNTA